MKVLCLKSSILGNNSVSNILVNEIINHIKRKDPSVSIIEKDLGNLPPEHLSLAVATAIRSSDISALNDNQKVEYNEVLQAIKELKEADMVVIGAPMYNLTISSGLKTWIDQICQAGLTFSYTATGPKGLVADKPVIIASSRGGIYSVPPADILEHQESYIRAVLGLIGLSNIKVIRAEGTNISEQMRLAAIEQAKAEIAKL